MDVLLVEDDVLDVEMVEVILSRDPSGPHRITRVDTLSSALDHLEAQHFDVVLVDLSLPDATGDEAASAITANHTGVPVIVLSGNADQQFATAVIGAGAQDYIVKGDSARELPRAMAYATERKAAEMRLKHLASYDQLTQLANRQEFCTQLEKACARADRHDTMVALMMIDLDHFKILNDTHGHHAGDELLKSVADKLRDGIRAGDTAARLGGDEFAVILEDIPHDKSVMRWTRQFVNALREPVTVGDTPYSISASIGGALYPAHGRTVDELLRCADMAMYDVKRRGRGNHALYDQRMHERRERHYDLETALRPAIAREELVPYFQPKISLADGSLVGMEALCRWERADGEVVEPCEFLPIARRAGLMNEVGGLMLRAVCRQIREWRDNDGPVVPVSINADAQEIGAPTFATRVINHLKRAKLSPRLLTVEITETTLVEPSQACLENLDMLRRSGVRIELDDFGAGHATFNYLRQFPLDALKLDRSLISGLNNEPQCETIVRAMISLGDELGLDVVAEGIETPAQLHTLRQIGCRAGQGKFISKPIPAHQLSQWQTYVQTTLRLEPLVEGESHSSRPYETEADAESASTGQLRWSNQREDCSTADDSLVRANVTAITSEVRPLASSGQ
ncbi:MAG: EAL domain-containing protein [Pseudomonadota bacterium]